jgi:hypothetical protein
VSYSSNSFPGRHDKQRPVPATKQVGPYTPACFERLYVDKAAGKIAAHTNSDDTLMRINGGWLIKDMKTAKLPEL